MGNSLELPKEPEHRLELRFEHPINLLPPGPDGSLRRLVSQIRLLSAPKAKDRDTVYWDQTTFINVPSSGVVVLDIYIHDPATNPPHTFIAQACLPYAGMKDLGIDSDCVPIRLALWPRRPTSQVPRTEMISNFQRDLQLFSSSDSKLTVWARQVNAQAAPPGGPPARFYSADMAMLNSAGAQRGPTTRRQAIQLAFENAELEARLQAPANQDPAGRGYPKEHLRQLQNFLDQNEQLKAQCQDVWNRIEAAHKAQRMNATNSVVREQRRQSLDLLQEELARNQERYRKLQEEYHTHIMDLQDEIVQARADADAAELKVAALSTPPAAEAMAAKPSKGKGKGQGSRYPLQGESEGGSSAGNGEKGKTVGGNSLEAQFAELREQVEDLDRQLSAARKHKDMYDQARAAGPSEMALLLPPDHETRTYVEQEQKNKAELKEIQDALETIDAEMERRGLTEIDKLHKRINELYEELDQAQIEREDQRVRDESEERELRSDCDKLRGEIDEIVDETARYEAQVEALKMLGVMPRSQRSLSGPPDPVQDVKNELKVLNDKLAHSRELEQFQSAALEELEQEHELLIERLGTFSAASFGDREAPPPLAQVVGERVRELQRELDEVESSVAAKESELERLSAAAAEATQIAETMKKEYEARCGELDKQGTRNYGGLLPPSTS